MEMFIAVSLIVVGLAVGLLGLRLFRVMLPLAGLIVGAIAGFTGIQGIFGTGVTSTTIAVLVACILGLVMAVLSYAFFDIALMILVAIGVSSLFTIFGLALGLYDNGFALALLSLSGFILGAYLAIMSPLLSVNVVALATAFAGVGFILAGLFVIGHSITIDDLGSGGVIATVAERVNDSLWWMFVWIAGIVMLYYAQMNRFLNDVFPESLGYPGPKSSK